MKCPWSVTGQRNAAFKHIKALDKMLLLTIGIGLIYFGGSGVHGVQAPFATALGDDPYALVYRLLYQGVLPPTLTLSLDEGSPAYSMTWYLTNRRICGSYQFVILSTVSGMMLRERLQMLNCGMLCY